MGQCATFLNCSRSFGENWMLWVGAWQILWITLCFFRSYCWGSYGISVRSMPSNFCGFCAPGFAPLELWQFLKVLFRYSAFPLGTWKPHPVHVISGRQLRIWGDLYSDFRFPLCRSPIRQTSPSISGIPVFTMTTSDVITSCPSLLSPCAAMNGKVSW